MLDAHVLFGAAAGLSFRRFFLVDNVSGRDAGGTSLGSYASHILLFYGKEDISEGGEANIYMSFDYAPILAEDYTDDKTVSVCS